LELIVSKCLILDVWELVGTFVLAKSYHFPLPEEDMAHETVTNLFQMLSLFMTSMTSTLNLER